jgi:hypothetical protein
MRNREADVVRKSHIPCVELARASAQVASVENLRVIAL